MSRATGGCSRRDPAITRRDLAGGEPFVPAQAIDLATAISAYTTGGAYANFCETTAAAWPPARPPT
jgi:hypothetical protein